MKTIRIIAVAVFLTAFCFAGSNLLLSAKGETHVALKRDKTAKPEVLAEEVTAKEVISEEASVKEVSATDAKGKEKTRVLNPEEATKLLYRVDMEKLITSNNPDWMHVYNGFTGKDNYRIEFYINNVARDAEDPHVLIIDGKTRYKTNVLDFTGRMDIDKVTATRKHTYKYEEFKEDNKPNEVFEGDSIYYVYHVAGTFNIEEDKLEANAGAYTGKLFFDFQDNIYNDDLEQDYVLSFNEENDTKTAGLLMDGDWKSYTADDTRQMIAGKSFFNVANEILEDFYYGGRHRDINNKYRALGWEDYWENPEWWAESKEPKVSMK